jgi:hypothetical protein
MISILNSISDLGCPVDPDEVSAWSFAARTPDGF